jgi:tetratricopeptide (TPR) repeat protein
LAFQEFVQNPKEIEATNEMFQAQTYFEQALTAPAKDSLFNLALNGGEGKYGFIDMVENFDGTKAGNLSKYYAGMAYLNTNKYKEAINYLDDFSSDDAIIGPLAKGGIGDAFVQLGQEDKALAYYETAASMNKNDFTSPRFLLKAGTTALNIGKKEKAIKHFTEIIEKYPDATEVAKATANIGKANAMN